MRERSEARRKEKQLVIRGQEIELEHRHARLQTQLTQLMESSPDGTKTSEEVALEGRILREMLEIVERRNSLEAQLEAEKQRSESPASIWLTIILAIALYFSLHYLITLYQIRNHFPFI